MSVPTMRWSTTAPTMSIMPIAIRPMNARPVGGMVNVFTSEPTASCMPLPPARKAPRMRAIVKAIAANTAANPMKSRAYVSPQSSGA